MAGQLASTLRALATIGKLRERVDVLSERVAELTRTAEHALTLAEAAHRSVTGSDPAQALEIATATRDEVRRLSVELTEQLNRLAST
jgi:hypothetical protein